MTEQILMIQELSVYFMRTYYKCFFYHGRMPLLEKVPMYYVLIQWHALEVHSGSVRVL